MGWGRIVSVVDMRGDPSDFCSGGPEWVGGTVSCVRSPDL